MPGIAPEIFRKRLLVEGYFEREGVDAEVIRAYFVGVCSRLGLRTYGEPIVHRTGGQGQGGQRRARRLVPLIDSGINVACGRAEVHVGCNSLYLADFDESQATEVTREFFGLTRWETALF